MNLEVLRTRKSEFFIFFYKDIFHLNSQFPPTLLLESLDVGILLAILFAVLFGFTSIDLFTDMSGSWFVFVCI